MAGVFLTEGHRMAPHTQRKVKASHPWKAPAAKNYHVPNPAHVTGVSDEDLLHSSKYGLAEGCYYTGPAEG